MVGFDEESDDGCCLTWISREDGYGPYILFERKGQLRPHMSSIRDSMFRAHTVTWLECNFDSGCPYQGGSDPE